jgi:hypothetical protein
MDMEPQPTRRRGAVCGESRVSRLDEDVPDHLDAVVVYGGGIGWTGPGDGARLAVRHPPRHHRSHTPEHAVAYPLSSHFVADHGATRRHDLLLFGN